MQMLARIGGPCESDSRQQGTPATGGDRAGRGGASRPHGTVPLTSRCLEAGPGCQFEQVYAVHHASLLGYVLRRTGNADDAADVIAETFLTVWRRIGDIPAGEAAR